MGRTVRVPNTNQDTVARVLADAAVQADLTTAPATFEEAFVELSRRRTGIPD